MKTHILLLLLLLVVPTVAQDPDDDDDDEQEDDGKVHYYELNVYVKEFPKCRINTVQVEAPIYLAIFEEMNPTYTTTLVEKRFPPITLNGSNRRRLSSSLQQQLDELPPLQELEEDDNDDDVTLISGLVVGGGDDDGKTYGMAINMAGGIEDEDDDEEESASNSSISITTNHRNLLKTCPKKCRKKKRKFKLCIKLGCACNCGRSRNKRTRRRRLEHEIKKTPKLSRISKVQLAKTAQAMQIAIEKRNYCQGPYPNCKVAVEIQKLPGTTLRPRIQEPQPLPLCGSNTEL